MDITPTRLARKLLMKGELGQIVVGGKWYIPDCTIQITTKLWRSQILVSNANGKVIAKSKKFASETCLPVTLNLGSVMYEINIYLKVIL